FPTSFNGKDRDVKLTGEASFKIKHDPNHPFHIIAGDKKVEDIGTQFDVNAYDDEPVFKTTLVEGAAKVSRGNQSVTLKPGQQARIATGIDQIAVQQVDPENEIAWMNGKFRADGE